MQERLIESINNTKEEETVDVTATSAVKESTTLEKSGNASAQVPVPSKLKAATASVPTAPAPAEKKEEYASAVKTPATEKRGDCKDVAQKAASASAPAHTPPTVYDGAADLHKDGIMPRNETRTNKRKRDCADSPQSPGA